MSIFETMDLQELNKVTELSRTEKSCVWLVSTEKGKEFAILKEYQNKELFPLYERLKNVQSKYFPQIYQLVSQEDSVLLLEEYLPGETLQAKLEGEKKLTGEEITGYICAICEALQSLHNTNPAIVYRDLKPENVMIQQDGRVRLVDLGCVYIVGDKEYLLFTLIISALYFSSKYN